jgi:hypothetical protein
MLLDAELAALHGVTTRRLNEQVRRNRPRRKRPRWFEEREARLGKRLAKRDGAIAHPGRRQTSYGKIGGGSFLIAWERYGDQAARRATAHCSVWPHAPVFARMIALGVDRRLRVRITGWDDVVQCTTATLRAPTG